MVLWMLFINFTKLFSIVANCGISRQPWIFILKKIENKIYND